MLSVHEVLQRRYRIVRLIGKGSSGTIYEAIDENFGDPVAIKEVRYESRGSTYQGQNDLLKDSFERKAKSLSRARHPLVPYTRDYFLDHDAQYLVMDMVEGDDLGQQLLSRAQPFPVRNVLEWTAQLLNALDHLHNLSPPVVHGDIKPKNLKLTATGEVRLLDLGAPTFVDRAAFNIQSRSDLTPLNYSPIEQVIHIVDPTFREFALEKHTVKAEHALQQGVDARSDIFMVGATAYQLLTCQPATDIVKRAIDTWEGKPDPLPAPSDLNPDIPILVSECVTKALAIDQEDRYRSASEMILVLKEAAELGLLPSRQKSPIPDARYSELQTDEDYGFGELGGVRDEPTINDPPKPASAVSGVRHVPLWRAAAATAGVLALIGIAALIWLPGLGYPTTGVAAVDPAASLADAPVTTDISTSEPTAEAPALQDETTQPISDTDRGPDPAEAESNAVSREVKHTTAGQAVRVRRHSAEPRRNLSPNANEPPMPTKPQEEKKKITVDDLINDH